MANMYAVPAPELLRGNSYPGRGIILGHSAGGAACAAYFIMGRSPNSRNRIFEEGEGCLYTRPFDEALAGDTALTIYTAMRADERRLILTNGSQTEGIWQAMEAGASFGAALMDWSYEPDAPHYTPRISGVMEEGGYTLSILKKEPLGEGCCRYFYAYQGQPGLGRLIHTYAGEDSPLPSFAGEPRAIAIPHSIDEFANGLWNALDGENKISLYVRFFGPDGAESRLFNRNRKEGA